MTFKHQDKWPVFLKAAEQFKLTKFERIVLLAICECGTNKTLNFLNTKDQADLMAEIIKVNTRQYNKLMTEGVYEGRRRIILISASTISASAISASTIGKKENEAGIAYVPTNLDYISFFGSYSGSGYGWMSVSAPKYIKEKQKLSEKWILNMQKTVKSIQDHFNKKGV